MIAGHAVDITVVLFVIFFRVVSPKTNVLYTCVCVLKKQLVRAIKPSGSY